MRIRTLVAACLIHVTLALVVAAPAFADGVADEADLQFQIGADAYTKGDFTTALQHFLASNRLVPNRNVQFNIARAYEQLGRFPDAYRYYIDVSRGDLDPKLKTDVTAAIGRITPKVAVISVETTPPGAIVYLDRRDLGSLGSAPALLGLKAGTYKVLVELPGYEPAQREGVVATVGATATVKIELVRIVGTADISGPAGTAVRIDDDRGPVACQLPCSLQLPPGSHVAYFERPGFNVAPQPFTVTAKQTVAVKASSVAVVGSLLVSADESNALIEVDGQAVGFTPAVIPNIRIGKRRVRVSMRGYLPVEREVEIVTNTQTELRDLVLTPERSVTAASRETETIEDAPASVTVTSSQELEAFAYPTILDALRGVRGYAVNFDSIYGSAAVRGLGQSNDFSNRLLVLSDGAVLNENILYQPFIHYDGRVDLSDVQRIEIVRGPASVLYGTGAVSGVVNLVLKDRDEPEGIQGQVSSYNNSTTRARAGFVHKFGKDAGLWASVAGANSQGRNEALVFDNGDGQGAVPHTTAGFDKFKAYTITSKGWWNGFTLQGFWTQRDQTVPTGNYDSRFNDTRSHDKDSRFLIEGKYKRAFAGGHEVLVRAHGNYAGFNMELFYDDDSDVPTPGATYKYTEDYSSWWGGVEGRLSLALAKTLKLAVGTESVIHTRANMEGGAFDINGENFESSLSTNTPYQVFAGSALLDWRPHKTVRAQAGLRFDYWNLRGNQNAADGEEEGARSFQAASPRVALIVKPNDKFVGKLLFGSAFRAPSAYEIFYNDRGLTSVASNTCGETLDPERIYSLEAEGNYRINVDWVATLAAHGTVARNIIESVPIGDGCAMDSGFDATNLIYENSTGSQRIWGVDGELRREFRAGVMASLQYGFIHGRYAQAPTDEDGNALSPELPNAPTHYAGAKVIVPIVRSSLNGAFRAALEDRRRVDSASSEKSERAVVADMVASGLVGRVGLRYAVGVYNVFNWKYALPAAPYASTLMPENGRTFMFSLTVER